MSEPINFPFDEETIDDEPRGNHFMNDWSEEGFREYCDTVLTLIATAVDDTNEEVSDIKRNIRSIRLGMDDDFESIVSLRESVESQHREVTRLNRSFARAAAYSAALLGATGVILIGALLKKRR